MTAITLYVAAHEHDNQATVKGVSKDSQDASIERARLAGIADGEHPSNCTYESYQPRAYSIPTELVSVSEFFVSVAEFKQAETGLLGGFIIIEGQGSQAVMGIGLTAVECEESAKQWITADMEDCSMPLIDEEVDARLSDASPPVWVTKALLNFCRDNQAKLAAAEINLAREVQKQPSGILGLADEATVEANEGAVEELLMRYGNQQKLKTSGFGINITKSRC